ncbi:DUF6252 family protein [Chryseolinea sp. H1M3-3]|uniref:DUF6252 family protein n=1 Tax=Chryseolinea sp. H1M3-3 TaxID=3034144 RepID=UPI0023EAC8DA|nr:DUF6252 family protein [Chryseolinea sp. H1M3-3]
MKIFLIVFALTTSFHNSFCQDETLQKATELQTAVGEKTGAAKTSSSGYYLKAIINGKEWIASDMSIDKDNSNIVEVQGTRGNTFIKFNLYKPAQGKEKTFSDTSPATWSDESEMDIYVGKDGSVIVTKMDELWIEGTFSFTGKNSWKIVQITNGIFRIPNPKQFNQ